ncbi:hypothetical protein M1732_16995, partial [Salmonella enterica subsp. enterica serovar Give]|nr:hypothetical protein [Salmonella enterica subsp. enterica serovar Oranienburg]MCT7249975.1 hypothetical protein [Salmonella enterica subsp. enterica serovar Give]MCT7276318.1 hypothetical protein [Salmonella enterica subsp. enterica serovar Braenderup]
MKANAVAAAAAAAGLS